MIKIHVGDVISKGLVIEQTMPKEGIGLSDEEIALHSQLNIKSHLIKADGYIIANTDVRADFGYFCGRCLEEFHFIETRHYTHDFELTDDIEYVDLGEEIRQELILASPSKVLCKKDCKGMCPKCGVNLNIEPCKCKQ